MTVEELSDEVMFYCVDFMSDFLWTMHMTLITEL